MYCRYCVYEYHSYIALSHKPVYICLRNIETQKKIYYEPIKNILFDNFVLIVFVETKYTY